ncbi:MAG: NAD(P)-dependent oxidoreductase [Bryobacteraceae bacterium]
MSILLTESKWFSSAARDTLGAMGAVRALDIATREELLTEARDADVLWVRLRHYIGADVMDAAPELRAIATPTTGLTHIDLEEASRRGIAVISLRGETDFLKEIRATAEHTIALMLALMRRLPAAVAHAHGGGWDRDRFRGNELHGKTAGIVGYGRLGRIVAGYLQAFGCRVLAAERKDWEGRVDPPVELVPIEELLAHSDLVSLHVSLDSATEGFFNQYLFGLMKPGAWFINTARGELIDEAALVACLREGRLSGAAVDVIAGEHESGPHPLIEYARAGEGSPLIVTPHIGGCTVESMVKTEEFLAGRVLAWHGRGTEEGDR